MAGKKINYEKYKKPPIFLAILEIRYKDSGLKKIEDLLDCKKEVIKLFPKFDKQITTQLKLDKIFEGQPTVSLHNSKVDCLRYLSEEKNSQFTISLDRFNYQQSGKYTTFEDFLTNIKLVWNLHKTRLKNINIRGISLRFFNKIELQEIENGDPSNYFNLSIQAQQDLISDIVISYSIRYITSNPESQTHSIVSLSLEPKTNNHFPFILDIDVHNDNPIKNNNVKTLWEKFESLRNEKDIIFNQILTEKTKTIFR